jgi:hypothetical protein
MPPIEAAMMTMLPDPPDLPGGPSPWHEATLARLRGRLRNPLLRTLAIVAIELRPEGERY